MRCLDAWLCDMHGEGFCHEVDMRRTAMRLCESLDQGRCFRVRSVVIGSDQYHSEVGSSIPGYGKYYRGEVKRV